MVQPLQTQTVTASFGTVGGHDFGLGVVREHPVKTRDLVADLLVDGVGHCLDLREGLQVVDKCQGSISLTIERLAKPNYSAESSPDMIGKRTGTHPA